MVRGNYVLNELNEKLENSVGGKGVVQETSEWVKMSRKISYIDVTC